MLTDMTIISCKKYISSFYNHKDKSKDSQIAYRMFINVKQHCIEATILEHMYEDMKKEIVIELPTMTKCPMECKMCASTTVNGTPYYLNRDEIYALFLLCIRRVEFLVSDLNVIKKTIVSFTGIGETSLLYKEIAASCLEITRNYPKILFFIATMGEDTDCFKFYSDCHIPIHSLQLDFYSHKNQVIKRIIPKLCDTYDWSVVLKKALEVKQINPEWRIKINYLVIQGINDNNEEIDWLNSLDTEIKEKIIVKVSYLNRTKSSVINELHSPVPSYMEEIVEKLKKNGITAYLFGANKDNQVGCGQLIQGMEAYDNEN